MQLSPKCREQWVYPAIAALIPLAIQSVWLWHNTQLPISDTVEEFGSSYHIYKLAADHKWLKFITSFYDARDLTWRPIGFYLLLAPFQLLSGGNILFTADAITLTCTLVSCF